MSIESVSDLHSQSETEDKNAISSESEVNVPTQFASPEEFIRILNSGSCPSLSGQSTLTYQFGIKDESFLCVRLTANTGGGLFSNDWISCDLLEKFMIDKTNLTSGSFKALFPSKSVNTGGFIMAVLRSLGLLQVSEINSRWHEYVVGKTFEQLSIDEVGQEAEAKKMDSPKSKRKSKEA